MPSGASDGSALCTMALYEPLRNEPQIVITFRFLPAMTTSPDHFDGSRARARIEPVALRLLVRDRIYQHADPLDVDLAGIAVLHPDRRLARKADARGRAGHDDVARLERHALRN